MLKKLFLTSVLLLATLTLAACKADVYEVTFNSQGGSAVSKAEVEDGQTVSEPAAPTRGAADFLFWATDADGQTPYDFDQPVTEDITLYAAWDSIVLDAGTVAEEPIAPAMEGYRFEGWFYGQPGLTWLEPEAISFPLTLTEETELFGYWEPEDSKAVDYAEGETYTTSLDSSSSLFLNPLVYEWSHEDALIDTMATALYSTEVDWDKAIDEGVAEYPGDFSKIIDKTYSIEALDYVWYLLGAERYPINSDGEEFLTEDGKYDRDNASTYKDTEWTFHLRDDIYFEDGTNITAETFEYSLKMYLDPLLNNYRANIYYRTEDNKNGYPILNAYEYYLGDEDWANVGFEIVDDYTFTVTFFESISQSEAVAFANMRMVHPDAFEASLTSDRTNSTYGTPANPYVSYGAYVLKSWDENQRLVFNKNYDYLGKGMINYKSRVIEIVDDIDQRMNLFAQGDLSVAGLNVDYYAEYAESPNVYKSWDGYPQYMIVNLAPTKVTEGGHVQPDILFDARFRQALMFGFDRNYYATNIYAPNTASLLPVPLDTKSYNQDALYYSESPQHLEILEQFDIDPETEGYIPERATQLFNAAYADWVADGNTGPVQIKLISDNDEFSLSLVEYIESHFETLFGADKLDINIVASDPETNRATIRNWDFDLSLNSIGFGSSTGVWWQYQAIAFFGDWIGGGGLGLTQPWDMSGTDTEYRAEIEGQENVADYVNQIIEVDLTATYNYLDELGEAFMTDEELTGHLALYDMLKESTDPDTSEVKPAGIYKGPMQDLALIFVFQDSPFDGAAAEPFPGATNDSWNLVAALEALYYEHVPNIPTVTRSSATIYAENVVITWPAYSSAFGWGADRYRYLNTDPDFAAGLYNPNE
jgi:oligopeptide transport system substrate-binding protein